VKIDLTDKVALVTGASRGIGRAIALAFGAAGASVVVNFREDGPKADEVVKQIKKDGAEAIPWCADVGDRGQVEAMVEGVTSRFGQLDILVNNAGIIRDGLLLQMEEKDWEELLRINLGGVFQCSRFAARPMIRGHWGRIINLSSIAGTRGRKAQTNYSASKGAIDAFTRSLAAELGLKGVTVNAIAPGLIETDMTRQILPFADGFVHDRVALRRIGQPEDVAPLATFLASEQAGYITGQVITVDGGIF
jgi:3-oxoacyl-[acyl-carrier protein] reductase